MIVREVSIKDVMRNISVALSTALGVMFTLAGGLDNLFRLLLILMVVDFISGTMVAVKCKKKLCIKTNFLGLGKKMLIICFCIIGNYIDIAILKGGSATRTAILFFYISHEGMSILENSAKLNMPIPSQVKNIFDDPKVKALKEQAEEDKESLDLE